MSTATAPKPLTFRRWYGGNMFTGGPSAWATDGRCMLIVDRLRLKSSRSFISKALNVRYNGTHADGDAKAATVIAGAARETWTNVSRYVGHFHAAADERFVGDIKVEAYPERTYAVAEEDGKGSAVHLYEACAVDWMREHLKWSALRVDPKHGSLWFVDLMGQPIGLLMPIKVLGDAGQRLDGAVRLWASAIP